MVWLQSNENYNTVGKLDPSTCELELFERNTLSDIEPEIIHGFFSDLGDLKIGVYGVSNVLYLVIDEQLVKLAHNDTIEVHGPRGARNLCVLNNTDQVVAEVTYSLHQQPEPIPGDPTPFVSDEDFDIGLFASNVSRDPERRAIFTSK